VEVTGHQYVDNILAYVQDPASKAISLVQKMITMQVGVNGHLDVIQDVSG